MTDTQAEVHNSVNPKDMTAEIPALKTRKISEDEVSPALKVLCAAWLKSEVEDVKTANDFLNSVYQRWQSSGRITDGQVKGIANYATMKLRPNKWSNGKGEVTKVANLPTYDLRFMATGLYKHPSGVVLRISKSRRYGTIWANKADSGVSIAGTRADGTCFYTKIGASDTSAQQVLSDIATDPTGALVAYGKATSNCGLCGRPLKDQVSVHFSIGPVCLKRYVGAYNYTRLKGSYLIFDETDVAKMRTDYVNTPQVTLDNMSKGYTSPNKDGQNPFTVNADGTRIPDEVLQAQSRRRAAKVRYDQMMAKRAIRKEAEAELRRKQEELAAKVLRRDESGRVIVKPQARPVVKPHLSKNAKEVI